MKIELAGVPETLLWNLYNRAAEARRPDSILDDPKAVELVESIDYPFEKFGGTQMAQWHALRVKRFDEEVRRFRAEHPGGLVVALGEGLETQFWRVDDGQVRWLTVDLPETLEVRRRLLPDDPPRRRSLAASAVDHAWMDEVDASNGVLISAQGLLMYLRPPEVKALIAACAGRFPGGTLLFDALPRALVKRSQEGKIKSPGGYQAPAWQWGIDPDEIPEIAAVSPKIAEVRDLPLPRGRRLLALAPWAHRIPVVRNMRMMIVSVRFGD
ncbi:MAG TPA: class I SAM-dependent methyltransferase [Streptosporangiaceae bacterium]